MWDHLENEHVSPRPGWEVNKLMWDLRECILDGTIDREQDRDIIEDSCYNVSSNFLGPIYGLGINPHRTGVVEDEHVEWAMKHPIRLTGEAINVDALNGPGRKVDNEINTDVYFTTTKDGKIVGRPNYDHFKFFARERVKVFVGISNGIWDRKDNPAELKAFHKRYVRWLMSQVKQPKHNGNVTYIRNAVLTWKQQGAINDLFDRAGIKPLSDKVPMNSWVVEAGKVVASKELKVLKKTKKHNSFDEYCMDTDDNDQDIPVGADDIWNYGVSRGGDLWMNEFEEGQQL